MSPFVQPGFLRLPASYDFVPLSDRDRVAPVEPVGNPNEPIEQPKASMEIPFPDEISMEVRGYLAEYVQELLRARENNTYFTVHSSNRTGSYGRMTPGERTRAAYQGILHVEGRYMPPETTAAITSSAPISPTQKIDEFITQHPYMLGVFYPPEASLQDQQSQNVSRSAEAATHEVAIHDVGEHAVQGAMAAEQEHSERWPRLVLVESAA